MNAYEQTAIENLPATDKRLDEIRSHQGSDRVCMQISIYMYLQDGWPNESGMDECVKPFYAVRSEKWFTDERLSTNHTS